MKWLGPQSTAYVVPFLLAFPFLAGANGDGCSSVPIGSGAHDGGGSDDGGESTDAGGACVPADCAGLGATLEAKICPDGSGVGRSVCTRESDGKCAWDFPACPAVDAGVACPAIACNPVPQCPNGVVNDAHGCPTCHCAPAPAQDGGTCQNDADCGDEVCGFPTAAGCAAAGTCFPAPQVTCQAYSAACGCDGAPVNVACTGLPSGYARRPIVHTGECTTSADGGACCPPTWTMYSCSGADGGTGLACHNPAQGCASSATCGGGCDAVVSGRCTP